MPLGRSAGWGTGGRAGLGNGLVSASASLRWVSSSSRDGAVRDRPAQLAHTMATAVTVRGATNHNRIRTLPA